MNFYPFHIGDYLAHTSHLNDSEDLAYRRMMDWYYLNEKPLPADIDVIARLVRATPGIVIMILGDFFYQDEDGKYHSKRADEELAKYKAMQDGGRKGAEKRWSKGSDSPPIHPPMQTKNQEPLTKNHIKTTPNGFDEFWNSYDKKVGKPNTLKAWAKIKFQDGLLQTIIQKAKADRIAKPDNKYRKDPERWLKGQHWLDEVIVEQVIAPKQNPLMTNTQIEEAYRLECGKDPKLARFGSYYEMKEYVIKQRELRSRASSQKPSAPTNSVAQNMGVSHIQDLYNKNKV